MPELTKAECHLVTRLESCIDQFENLVDTVNDNIAVVDDLSEFRKTVRHAVALVTARVAHRYGNRIRP